MVVIFLLFMASYGLCFGLQNKATFLHGKWGFLDRMFDCPFCTGFHCGWLSWLAGWGVVGPSWLVGWGVVDPVCLAGACWPRIPIVLIVWVLGVAIWCDLIDAMAHRLEVVS